MTVKELIQALLTYDMDDKVILCHMDDNSNIFNYSIECILEIENSVNIIV